MNHTFLLRALAAVACWMTMHANADSQPSCYPSDIAAPRQSQVTVGVVDLTTFRDPDAVRDFRATMMKAAGVQGQRVVLLTFAGIARGQHLSRVYDRTLEAPVTDEETVANARIGPFKASQRCVSQRLREHAASFSTALDTVLGQTVPTTMQRSEIVYALHQVLADFGDEGSVRVLVFSDGLQNSRDLTFYSAGRPRRIMADAELKTGLRSGISEANDSRPIRDAHAIKVLWFGLLASEDPKIYADVQQLAEITKFWRSVLTHWGIRDAQLGPTLNNPKL
jgi:hypothetical protein